MNLLSREEYNRINETVIGLRRLATYEDLQKVTDPEFDEMVRYLLLISNQNSARLCESHYNLLKELMINSGLVEESRFESFDQTLSLNENYLNEEGWDDDISKGIQTAGVTAVAGAASLAAYISFLFKKKKIRKAWEAVRDKKLEKITVDKDLADKLREFEPELSKEEVEEKTKEIEAKKSEKKTELDNFDADKEKETTDLKTKLKDVNAGIREIDPTQAPKEEEETPTEETPTADTPTADTTTADTTQKTDAKETTEESVNEEGEKPAENKESGGEDGELQKAQQKVKDATLDPKEIEKEVEKLQKQIDKIEDQRKGLKSDDSQNKKLGEQKAKLADQIKQLKDGENPEKEAAQKEVDKIKGNLEKLLQQRSDIKDELSKNNDVKALKAEKQALKDEVSSFDDELKDIKEKGKPRGGEKEKAQAEEQATKEKEQLSAEVEQATKDADRISGTSGGGEKASGLGGKIFGFAKGYVQKIKAEHDQEVLQAKRDAITTNDMLSDKDKAKQEKALDSQERDAEERMKQGEKAENAAKDKVDASDSDIDKAEQGVKDKQAEIDAKEAEDKKKDVAKRKEAIDSEIERINQKIEGAKEAIKSGKVPAEKKESVEANIKAFNDKKVELRKMKDKLGESAYYKFSLAILERDIDTLLNEYNIIVETRKELLEEEPAKTKSDDSGKAKEDKGNTLQGKKVVLVDMRNKDMGQLDGATGEIIKVFKENEREPEGDLPMRTGDPQVYKIKLDDPKDPMYPEINLTDKNFKVKEDKPEKKADTTNESFRSKFYKAYNDSNQTI